MGFIFHCFNTDKIFKILHSYTCKADFNLMPRYKVISNIEIKTFHIVHGYQVLKRQYVLKGTAPVLQNTHTMY